MALKIVFPPIPVSRGSRTPALLTPYLKGQFGVDFASRATEEPGTESLISYVRLGPNVFERHRQSEITKKTRFYCEPDTAKKKLLCMVDDCQPTSVSSD